MKYQIYGRPETGSDIIEYLFHELSIDYEFIEVDEKNVKSDEKILKINSYFKNQKISLSNTGGILLDKKFILDQTRPGIGIYGYDANGKNIILNKFFIAIAV